MVLKMYKLKTLLLLLLLKLLLINVCLSNPVIKKSDENINGTSGSIDTEMVDMEHTLQRKIDELQHVKREIGLYKEILSELSELATDYGDSEYHDLKSFQSADKVEIRRLIEFLSKYENKTPITGSEDRNKNEYTVFGTSLEQKVQKSFDSEEMQGDAAADSLSSSSESGFQQHWLEQKNSSTASSEDEAVLTKLPNIDQINPTLLRNFNLTVESVKRMRDARKEQQDVVQDRTYTMEETADLFNLTLDENKHVVPNKQLAKLLRMQAIQNSMNFFVNRNPKNKGHTGNGGGGGNQESSSNSAASGETPQTETFKKTLAFYTKCQIPKHADYEAWTEGPILNYFYNITSYVHSEEKNLTVDSAKLRLYKMAAVNTSVAEQNGGSSKSGMNDELIRISVYWYTRALKKHRVKRKLSDSRMVPSSYIGWVELDMAGATTAWGKTGRNLGVAVVVEDQEGNILDAVKMLVPPQCVYNGIGEQTTTAVKASDIPPLPWFLYANNLDEIPRFPRLDISTSEEYTPQSMTFDNEQPLTNDTSLYPFRTQNNERFNIRIPENFRHATSRMRHRRHHDRINHAP